MPITTGSARLKAFTFSRICGTVDSGPKGEEKPRS